MWMSGGSDAVCVAAIIHSIHLYTRTGAWSLNVNGVTAVIAAENPGQYQNVAGVEGEFEFSIYLVACEALNVEGSGD